MTDTWRAAYAVEVENYGEGEWGVFALDSDYPIALCGNENDARHIAHLWNTNADGDDG
jgi:hypothetical protein